MDKKVIHYQKYRYIMLNKPKGVVSAAKDCSQQTVLDLVPADLFRPGLFPAGRLDKDTTGFVLLTDDGDFAHKILSPKSHVEKTYIATLDGPVSDKMIAAFSKGVTLKDGYRCLPAKVSMLSARDGFCEAEIILSEGKYHQVKRMAAACGHHVLALKRTKIGRLSLDKALNEGDSREILHKERNKILEL